MELNPNTPFDNLPTGLNQVYTRYKNWFRMGLAKRNGSYMEFDLVKQTKSSIWLKIRYGVQDEDSQWQEVKIFKTSKFKPNQCKFIHYSIHLPESSGSIMVQS